MGKKSILHYIKRGKFAKVAALLHPGCHQGPTRTAFDRYPEIFAAAAVAAPDARRVLSFGCATGEECVSLATYFPAAEIVGADINPVILLKARKHQSDRIRFVYASDRTLSQMGGFDAVFCMAVLRHAGRYSFEDFEERALFLETLVRPGGLLVIQFALPFRRRGTKGLLRDDPGRRASRHRVVPSRRRYRSRVRRQHISQAKVRSSHYGRLSSVGSSAFSGSSAGGMA